MYIKIIYIFLIQFQYNVIIGISFYYSSASEYHTGEYNFNLI